MSGSKPKVRASSGTMGRHEPAHGGVADQVAQQPGEGHRGRRRLLARPGVEVGEGRRLRAPPACLAHDPDRYRAGQHLAPGREVLVGRRALDWAVVGRLIGLEGFVGDLLLQVEAVAQHAQLRRGHLLDLMRGVASLDLGPERPSLDRLGEDHRGLAHLLGRPACRRRRACGSRGRRGAALGGRRRRDAPPGGADGGRDRRSAPGCRRPTPWRTSGTPRRGSCSSCPGARRRRPGRAARPTSSPR